MGALTSYTCVGRRKRLDRFEKMRTEKVQSRRSFRWQNRKHTSLLVVRKWMMIKSILPCGGSGCLPACLPACLPQYNTRRKSISPLNPHIYSVLFTATITWASTLPRPAEGVFNRPPPSLGATVQGRRKTADHFDSGTAVQPLCFDDRGRA